MKTIVNRSVRYLVGLAIGSAVAIALVLAQGESIAAFASAIWESSFAGPVALLDLLRWSSPLLLSGLAYVVAARAGIFNTGVEGQVIVGALCAAVTGLVLDLPAILLIPVVTIAGALGGALWALPAAWLFRRYGINEVVVTLMLNYVAVLVCAFLARTFFLARHADGSESITVTTSPMHAEARYQAFTGVSDANWTLLPVLVIVVVGAVVLLRTKLGYEISAVGDSPRFARYAGIDAGAVQMRAFLASGAIGGLVGAFEVQGILGRYVDGAFTNFGWDGILVGLLAMNHPVGIFASSAFLGVLKNSQLAIQQFTAVSPFMIQLIVALFILVFALDPIKKLIERRRR